MTPRVAPLGLDQPAERRAGAEPSAIVRRQVSRACFERAGEAAHDHHLGRQLDREAHQVVGPSPRRHSMLSATSTALPTAHPSG